MFCENSSLSLSLCKEGERITHSPPAHWFPLLYHIFGSVEVDTLPSWGQGSSGGLDYAGEEADAEKRCLKTLVEDGRKAAARPQHKFTERRAAALFTENPWKPCVTWTRPLIPGPTACHTISLPWLMMTAFWTVIVTRRRMVYARKRNKCEASVWAGFCIFAITSTSPDWWWLLPAFIAFTVLRVSSDVEPWWLCGAESLKHLEYFAPDFDLN